MPDKNLSTSIPGTSIPDEDDTLTAMRKAAAVDLAQAVITAAWSEPEDEPIDVEKLSKNPEFLKTLAHNIELAGWNVEQAQGDLAAMKQHAEDVEDECAIYKAELKRVTAERDLLRQSKPPVGDDAVMRRVAEKRAERAEALLDLAGRYERSDRARAERAEKKVEQLSEIVEALR